MANGKYSDSLLVGCQGATKVVEGKLPLLAIDAKKFNRYKNFKFALQDS